jgi:hypothetical protein
MNTNKNTNECDQYGCYPGVMTQFTIDETERGCNDWQFSGQKSTICPCSCGGSCVFCVPISFVLDIAFIIPCGLGWGINKIVKEYKQTKPQKPKITIVIQPK